MFACLYRVYKISSKSQYAGDEASSWFSKLLNTECQMYQVYEPRYSKENPSCRNVALPGDKVCQGTTYRRYKPLSVVLISNNIMVVITTFPSCIIHTNPLSIAQCQISNSLLFCIQLWSAIVNKVLTTLICENYGKLMMKVKIGFYQTS